MRIGFVSPYAWDVPGGVQAHIKDLALHYRSKGHEVSVIAPAVDESSISEDFVIPAGRPEAIPYNGAVARVLFGPVAASRVRQWISRGEFDVLHLHEPAIPSLSLLACSIAHGPMVGTFHAAAPRQKVAFAIAPLLEPIIEKLRARIAVSEFARETLRIHLETDAIVIPNGIDVLSFIDTSREKKSEAQLTVGFIGRFGEPRKGLNILLSAIPDVVAAVPNVRFLIAGPGEPLEAMQSVDPRFRSSVQFLGRIADDEKAEFFQSLDIYVAPNTGGESFGIILTEAMAARSAIIASDLPAFEAVLGNGKYGAIFPNGDSKALAAKMIELLRNKNAREALGSAAGQAAARFDWEEVGNQIMNVYLHAAGEGEKVSVESESRGLGKLFARGSDE